MPPKKSEPAEPKAAKEPAKEDDYSHGARIQALEEKYESLRAAVANALGIPIP